MSTEATAPAVEMVTIAEAARRLDVSADTIRRRLKRGEISGERRRTKAGETWFVAVPAAAAVEEAAAMPPLTAAEREELVVLRERVAGLERIVEVSQREAASAREERDVWRRRAEESDEAQRELRVIIAKALPGETARIALDAGAATVEERQSLVAKAKRFLTGR